MEHSESPDVIIHMDCSYSLSQDGRLILPLDKKEHAPALAQFVHSQFRTLALHHEFPCVGAKSAINRGMYQFGLYLEMGSAESTTALCRDLRTFITEYIPKDGYFATFIASFVDPISLDEEQFESLLWQQLQRMHENDEVDWDETVSSDPNDPSFAFSFAGCAFFVIGLHASSSRWARRFAWSTLIFNAHHQFEQLRANGKFERMQRTIRVRDATLQGEINPSLVTYQGLSAARQYSGRLVEKSWICPFQLRRKRT